ncbi:hypothetical protein [Wolbachia pipientis]|uniref:hypothetical protein n=1 Tax=Wolbachia pipientis TaxID=955 RepID=UPI0025A4361D|nr:hypothetical protein [Wolbachia pipientis]MDM8335169.1 hypothetical protein [Wolbachia pipientis]
MDKFKPVIMAIGENDIKEVEQKVNEKVKEIKPPDYQVNSSSAEQVAGTGEEVTP